MGISQLKGKRWNEPVEIDKIGNMREYILIIGSTINSRSHIRDLIPSDEIDSFPIEKIEINFTIPPNKVFLAFETKRYRYASPYDPLLAINTSKLDPLPHQIEAMRNIEHCFRHCINKEKKRWWKSLRKLRES